MIIKADNASGAQAPGVPPNFRCPRCSQLGTFELLIGNSQDIALAGGFRIMEKT